MKALTDWPPAARRRITGVFTDIDITPDALDTLAALKAAGFTIVTVTGPQCDGESLSPALGRSTPSWQKKWDVLLRFSAKIRHSPCIFCLVCYQNHIFTVLPLAAPMQRDSSAQQPEYCRAVPGATLAQDSPEAPDQHRYRSQPICALSGVQIADVAHSPSQQRAVHHGRFDPHKRLAERSRRARWRALGCQNPAGPRLGAGYGLMGICRRIDRRPIDV